MRVGITGHQNIDALAEPWLSEQLRAFVRESSPLVGVSSLAAGADQLFAEVVLAGRQPLEVVLPFAEYADAFVDAATRAAYERLIATASKVVTLERQSSDELSYLQAGRFVVRDTEMMVAVWDGRPARGTGGTGDIVRDAVQLGRPVLHLDPITQTRRILRRNAVTPP